MACHAYDKDVLNLIKLSIECSRRDDLVGKFPKSCIYAETFYPSRMEETGMEDDGEKTTSGKGDDDAREKSVDSNDT